MRPRRTYLAATLLALLCCATAPPLIAAPTKLVGVRSVPEHKYIALTVAGDVKGASLRWTLSDEELLHLDESVPGRMLFTGPPGTYRVRLEITRFTLDKEGKISADTENLRTVCKIVAKKPVPPPPVPPGPVPPPPPVPPVPPGDPLTRALQAAYAADSSPSKAQDKTNLAGLYLAAVEEAAHPDVTSWANLFSMLQQVATGMKLSGKLPGVQALIQAEIKPVATGAFDAAGRSRIAACFARVGAALGAVR